VDCRETRSILTDRYRTVSEVGLAKQQIRFLTRLSRLLRYGSHGRLKSRHMYR